MAQLVVSSAAAAATFVATGGNVFAANLAFAAAGAAFSAYKASKQRIDGPRLTDAKIITANFGEIIPYVIGAGRVAGQVWWQSEIRETATTQEQGKGGGPKSTTYSYSSDVLFGLASNVKGALLRVFLNGKLVWSQLPGADQATIDASADSDLWDRITFYGGSETQLPDPTYEAAVGTANAVAYRGRSTVFIENLQLGNSGQIPNLTFEVGELADLPGITINYKDLSVYDAQITREGTLNDFAETTIAKFGQSVPTGANSQRFVAQAQTPSQFEGWLSWTAECWFYLTAYQTNSAILSTQISTAVGGFALRVVNNKLSGQLLRSGNFPVTVTADNDLPLNQWHHIRMRVTPSLLAVDLNGVQIGDSPITGATMTQLGANLDIGQNRRDGQVPFAYFDEVRISKVQRTGPAPSARFVVDADTVFLWRCDAIQTAIVGYPTLRETVEDLCARSGLPSNAYDASALASITQPVRSVVIAQVGAARATLESLRSAFYFDVQLSDKLYFVPRATTPVAEINFSDLAAGSSDADGEPFAIAHSSDLEIPAQVAVRYVNVEKDYQDGLEISDRGISGQATQEVIDLPIGLLPNEAKTLADGYSIDNLAALTTGSISLPITYSRLLPADVVTVRQEDGALFPVRLTSKREEDFVLSFEWRRHDALSLVSAGVTDTTYTPATTIDSLSNTNFLALDIPLLRDSDNSAGYYVAAKPDSISWPGAEMYSSTNNVDFSKIVGILESSIFGVTTTVLPSFPGPNVRDFASSVNVNLGSGQIASASWDALFADSQLNVLLVGDEIMRFATATLISTAPNIYTIRNLMRGLQGTEWAVTSHVSGERVVVLRPQGIRRVTTDQAEVNAQRFLKAVTFGRPLDSVTSQTFTNTGISQKPLAPTDIKAQPQPNQDLLISWARRSRLSSVFLSVGGLPVGETIEEYRVRIYDLDSPSILKRTIVVNNTSQVVYTKAQQIADGFSFNDDIRIDVTQVSGQVGEGRAGTATVKSAAVTQPQITQITIGGVFVAGVQVFAQLGSTRVTYTTQAGDATLAGIAASFAAAIDLTADYSATAVGNIIEVLGPNAASYGVSVGTDVGDNVITMNLLQTASPQVSGISNEIIISFGTPTQTVLPGTRGTLLVQRLNPPLNLFASGTSQPFQQSFTSALQSLGDELSLDWGNSGNNQAYSLMLLPEPPNPAYFRLFTPANEPYNWTAQAFSSDPVNVQAFASNTARGREPANARPQIITATFTGTVSSGWKYIATIGGVAFEYTATGGDTMNDVANGLALLIDADVSYTSTASTNVLQVAHVSNNVPFAYSVSIQSSSLMLSSSITQSAS